MEHDEQLRIARRRASLKFGFLAHLAIFVAINLALYAANRFTMPGFSWYPFPLGGWAVGLAIHGLAVFLTTSGLRERMVERELRKLRPGSDAK